jgi:hypothetical protein
VHENPSTVFLWDEVGFLFKSTKGRDEHKAGVIPFLMKLYSLASVIYKGKSYAEADKQKIIVQPCVSFYGTSTIETFRDGVSAEELEDGWIARVLMFRADPNPIYRKAMVVAPPESLVEALKVWRRLAVPEMTNEEEIGAFMNAPVGAKGEPIPIPFTFLTSPEADAEFARLREYSRNGDFEYKTLWLKSEELARRVALIMAAGRSWETRTIEKIDAVYACRLVCYCIADFADNVAGDVGGDAMHKHIVSIKEYVKKCGAVGALRSEISKHCSRWPRDKEAAIKHLLDCEEIFAMVVGKGVKYWHQDFREAIDDLCRQPKTS